MAAEDTQAISSGAGVVPVRREGYDGRFDCKLCEDLARDAVVSFCGHLFCWSCLAQHLKKRCRFCPICHEQVSAKKIIPVYGGGGKEEEPADGVRPRPGPPLVTVKRRHPTKPSVPVWFPIPEEEDVPTETVRGAPTPIAPEDRNRNELEYLVYSHREHVEAYMRLRITRKVQILTRALERYRAEPEFEFTSTSFAEILRFLEL